MKEIPLTKGYVTTVDDQDFDRLKDFNWHALVTTSGKVYARRFAGRVNGKRNYSYMHRDIMGNDSMVVDHIKGNTLNNCRSNLRSCTQSQNAQNSVCTHGASKFKGVSICNIGKYSYWRATIKANGKRIFLGVFKSEIQCAIAYNNAALHYFGAFANINVIPTPQPVKIPAVNR